MKHLPAFLLLTILFACSPSLNNNSSKMPAFDKEGHRGCRGLMPENTIPAMLYALELGVNTLEMDISFSKDKVALLSHEPFFNHEITTKPDGTFITEKEEKSYNLYQLDYNSIIKYDVGLKPHPRFPDQKKMATAKPRLADLIDSVANYMKTHKRKPVYYNIETKTLPIGDNIYHPAPAEFVELLMKVINEKGIAKQVTIQSFDPRTLQYLHTHYPKMRTALLVEANNMNSFRKQLNDLGFNPTIYSPEFTLVTETLVKSCHDLGIKIIPWTVNDKKKIDELKALGVDGIISDFPDLLNQ